MEVLALAQLRRAPDGATARVALAGFRASRHVAGPSMLLLLLTGLRLARAYWQWRGAWIGLGLAGLVSVGLVGGLMTGRRLGRLQKSLGDGGTATPWITGFPALRTSFMIRAALLAAVVYLMTVKPG
jgi:hypothetical protein